MRRAVPVIATTVGGLALIAGFHTKPARLRVATNSSASVPPGAADSTTRVPQPVAAPRRATTVPPPTVPPSRAVDGPVVYTDYGPVQVRITLSGSRIVDVQALQLPHDRARSASISENAGPQLRREALAAQSARIDGVSGASYTSEGYAESLQGALDRAGL